ncbi:MAG TPA: ABC transporter ATP-binding protein [Chloroflexota bacterium]|jgi:ABC-type multidrug transport system ATPase subunit|nr:ABC transporter ATP-binding protein [Chloroflexota bacterium]
MISQGAEPRRAADEGLAVPQAGPAGRAFVEARDVVKRYRSGTLANDRISLDAQPGEVVALLGPNGAGKTTFVLQLLGLLAPTSGSIVVGGLDVVRNPAGVKRLASYQPQGHMAMGGVEVRHALTFTGRLRGRSDAEARRQAEALSAEFGLRSVLGTPLNQLSGGWRRLVDVAVAFMGTPRLIVLDEPTNGLDPVHRRLLWDRLNALRQTRDVTCLVVTHNLLEAERAVDRVVVVQRGRVVADGSPGALKERLGGTLGLDLYLRARNGVAEAPAGLLSLGSSHEVRPGHLRLFLAREAVAPAIALLMAPEASELIDDFQLAPPSLEDVYLRLEEDGHARGAA